MFYRDGLNFYWNELIKDGEVMQLNGEASSGIDEFPNSDGAIARRGIKPVYIWLHFSFYYSSLLYKHAESWPAVSLPHRYQQ